MIILEQEDGSFGLLADELQDFQRIVGVVDLLGPGVHQAVHDGPVAQLVWFVVPAIPVQVIGDRLQFRLDPLFLGRDEIQARVTGLQVMNDAGARIRRQTYVGRGWARF
ncbi:MAG: hypothetical protein BWY06_03433 [Candidatus Latescibacteria bacterium ADurb.Bin168]|nr:MAG: hypothetical protein BWY06_03433 [Candidatus Latescibacteria bacterium ADurb.Bin168]